MPAAARKDNRLVPTNEDTLGPYYPAPLCDTDTMDLVCAHRGLICAARGRRIILKGRVLDRFGDLAHGALIEFWQANAEGLYRTPATASDPRIDPWFDGYARTLTPDGRFELSTIKPGRDATTRRAPHVTLTLFSDGITRVVTQIFFEDEDANEEDPLLRSLPSERRQRLIARHDGRRADGAEVYAIDIVLSGEAETPFFDDLTRDPALRRRLEVGPTDLTSDRRTPRARLLPVPETARVSFAPFAESLPTPAAREADLTRLAPGRPRADGDAIEVTGRIADDTGRPLRGHLVEIWNANMYGRYTHIEDRSGLQYDPNFLGIGRVVTDDEGRYGFLTIRPGAYLARPDINRYRPRHIHLSVRGGSARLVTQMYFPGDPHNDRDPMRILMGDDFVRNLGRKHLPGREELAAGYRFDIVVGGPNAGYYESE